MKNSIIKNTKTVLIAIIILACSCNDTVKEKNAFADFYGSLHSMINENDFISPLQFAQAGNLNESLDISFTETAEGIECNAGSDSYRITFSPLSVVSTGDDRQKDAVYSIKIHYKDGTTKTVNSISKPRKNENKIVFQTGTDDAELEFEAYEGFIKWSIKCDENLVDTVTVTVTTAGPYFGGGERFMSSRLDGRTITNQPMDHYRLIEAGDEEVIDQYEPSYLQIPFFITPAGLGWYFDNAATMHMSFDKAAKFFEVRIPGSHTDFYVFNEDNPKDVLSSYTALIGRQPALPDWAFGIWVTALQGKDSVYSKVDRLKKWDIPVTAIWMYDFEDLAVSSGFSVANSYRYGDIRELTDSLHKMGLKAITYVHPFSFRYDADPNVANTVRNFYYLDSLNLLLKLTREPDTAIYQIFNVNGQYDYYNPKMYDVWDAFLNQTLVADSFDGWMEDFGDVGYTYNHKENKWEPLPVEINYDMSDHEYFNMYPLVFHKLTYQLSSGYSKDVVSFSRSGSAGSAAFCPLIWGGDQTGSWDKKLGYPSAITAAISIGLSGYGNWTPDILSDSPSRELWMRWVQFGAFTPLMRDHLWHYDPKTINLWTDESTQKHFKKYADIHTELLPHLKTAADEYQQTGCPIIRHMFLEFPEDSETLKCEYQYMLGDELLVAPVVEEGATSKDVYFPKGAWRDYWTKEEITSEGEWMTVAAPVEIIPVFERVSE